MKKKTILLICMGLLLFFCLSFIYLLDFFGEPDDETTINNLAYDSWKKSDNLLYIVEEGTYEPYIVITNKYYGKTMLMRKYILDEMQEFNSYENKRNTNAFSYYRRSAIDNLLSHDFYNSLSVVTKEYIAEVDIEITNENSIITHSLLGKEKLKRKVFLLSACEIDAPELAVRMNEGIRIKYFFKNENSESRIAYDKEGMSCSYWLRTPNVWCEDTVSYVSGIDGAVDTEQVSSPLGVRPVFCVEGDTPVFKKEVESIGEVYVLE